MSTLRRLASCVLFLAMACRAEANGQLEVSLSPQLGAPQSGRLIVFAKPIKAGGRADEEVDFDVESAAFQWIAAREVTGLKAGEKVVVDSDSGSYPQSLSSLPAGTYEFQAVLDRNHDYAYGGRGGGDLVSSVITATLPGPVPALALEHETPDSGTEGVFTSAAHRLYAYVSSWWENVTPIDFNSPLMSRFRHESTSIHGWVALPPGYDKGGSFPTVYSFAGFGQTLRSLEGKAVSMTSMMRDGSAPPMIWVYLDYAIATGTHEFADSANNGPWGEALTKELIPALERQYKMDARPSGRYLSGHSSGGWAALFLQVRYPKFFGGAWPTSPDPSDFHDFFHVDLYRPQANLYHDADGSSYLGSRAKPGERAITLQQYAQSEAVLGTFGGQFSSFEWVFSPHGRDDGPVPLYDRASGDVDPKVAAYWIENYDIAHIIVRDWARLKPDLDGKIHLTVGTADTYFLDGPAHRLESAMKGIGAKTDFRYLSGKTHGDLLVEGSDRYAGLKKIAWEIYAQARPGEKPTAP